MKIEFIKSFDEEENRYAIEVRIDGKLFMDFFDGDPEDNNLRRNFNDIFKIPILLKKVRNTSNLTVIEKFIPWDELSVII